MRQKKVESWVVYRMPLKGSPEGMRAVCEQGEWEEKERAQPGVYTLIQAGFKNEGEAERLARGTSGDRPPRTFKAPKYDPKRPIPTVAPAPAEDATPS